MNQKMTCEICREALPLIFAEALTSQEVEPIRRHLEECAECRAFLEEERVLFEMACVEEGRSPLVEHPSSELLDKCVNERAGMSSGQLKEIEEHIKDCDLCTQIVAELAKLPENLDDLVASEQIPLISRMDAKSRQKVTIIEISRRFFWRPLAAYAAAAAVVLISLLYRPSPAPDRFATVSGVIPVSSRGDEQLIVFESPSRQCYLVLKYHVDPEPGHQYDFEIQSEMAGQPSQVFRDCRDFDPQGNATLRLLLEVGSYRFVSYDIADGDTIKVERAFDLKALQ